jgi:hypothetical protein
MVPLSIIAGDERDAMVMQSCCPRLAPRCASPTACPAPGHPPLRRSHGRRRSPEKGTAVAEHASTASRRLSGMGGVTYVTVLACRARLPSCSVDHHRSQGSRAVPAQCGTPPALYVLHGRGGEKRHGVDHEVDLVHAPVCRWCLAVSHAPCRSDCPARCASVG